MHIYMGEWILVVSVVLCRRGLVIILILTTTGMAHPHRTRRVVGVPVARRRRHDVVVRVRPLLVVFSWFVVVGLLGPLSMTATAFRVVTNIRHRPGHRPSQHRRPSWGKEFSVLPKDLDMLKEEDCTCTTSTAGATTLIPNPESEEWTWISLTEDGGVRKAVLQQQVGGDGLSDNQENKNQKNKNEDLSPRPLVVTPGSSAFEVVISYQGRWVDAHWSTHDVLECWLLQQQGMTRNDPLYQAFQNHDMDEAKLTNNTTEQQDDHPFLFTEAFVQNTLGVTSKMACKKLVMAARRLKAVRDETIAGTVFDQKDHYTVTIGESNNKNNSSSSSKTVIRGMRIALATMTVGEVSKIRIRSDYAYGAEGYRRSTGEVMVPPFCTLEFQVHVKSIRPLSS
jgi:FKBP-type peptidyl-prolyl cis-trans isomerase